MPAGIQAGQKEASVPVNAEKEKVLSQYGKVPAFFIENKGQTDNKVKYYFKGNDNVYFTDDGVMFQKSPQNPPLAKGGKGGFDHLPKGDGGIDPTPSTHNSLAYKLDFLGAKTVSPQARNELNGKVNYLIGNDRSKWHSNIPTYQEIVYTGLYPSHSENPPHPDPLPQGERIGEGDSGGIDLVYKGVPGGMKYEFIVQPGANPDDIKLAYTGIEGLSIDDSGNLIIHTSLGDVKDAKPYCYQEIDGKEVEVEGRFVIARSGIPRLSLRGSETTEAISCNLKDEIATPSARNDKFAYGFEVSSYNHNYPLVIDPGLEYSTFLGYYDYGTGIAVDGSGNAYVTGNTRSTDFPTTAGAYDTSYNGRYYYLDYDAFVSKLYFVPPKICHTCPSLFIVKPGKTECKKFKVWNCGEGTLNWTVSEDCDWLTLSPSNGTSTGEEDIITACVTAGKKAKGNCECTVTITGEGASNSPQTCVIKLRVK